MAGNVRQIPATDNCTGPGYAVEGSEELNYSYSFLDNVFNVNKNDLASYYTKWGRVLVLLDETVHSIYGDSIRTCESEWSGDRPRPAQSAVLTKSVSFPLCRLQCPRHSAHAARL